MCLTTLLSLPLSMSRPGQSPSSSACLAVPAATTSTRDPCAGGTASPALQPRTLGQRWSGSQTQSPAQAPVALNWQRYQRGLKQMSTHLQQVLLLRQQDGTVTEPRRQERRWRVGKRRRFKLHLISLSCCHHSLLASSLCPSCPPHPQSSPPSTCRCR